MRRSRRRRLSAGGGCQRAPYSRELADAELSADHLGRYADRFGDRREGERDGGDLLDRQVRGHGGGDDLDDLRGVLPQDVTAEDGVVPAVRDELAGPVRPPVGDRAEQVAVVRGAGHDDEPHRAVLCAAPCVMAMEASPGLSEFRQPRRGTGGIGSGTRPRRQDNSAPNFRLRKASLARLFSCAGCSPSLVGSRCSRAVGAAGARLPDTEEVTGSNPVRPTIQNGKALVIRGPAVLRYPLSGVFRRAPRVLPLARHQLRAASAPARTAVATRRTTAPRPRRTRRS
jgi:hypothetical protein